MGLFPRPWAGAAPAAGRAEFWGDVPGGYRNTFNDNLVLIMMIETLHGLRDADKIASPPRASAASAASGDQGNSSAATSRVIRTMSARSTSSMMPPLRAQPNILCGPCNWLDRPDFNCFQGPGSHINAPRRQRSMRDYVRRAPKKALGPLWQHPGQGHGWSMVGQPQPAPAAPRGGRPALDRRLVVTIERYSSGGRQAPSPFRPFACDLTVNGRDSQYALDR